MLRRSKMDIACEVWANIDSQRCIRSRGCTEPGKPAAKTCTNGFETLRDAEWSAIKRVKRGEPFAPCALSSAGGMRIPSSVCHFLHSTTPTTTSMMNEPSSKVESSSPGVPGMFVGRPHYKNCYRHLARPPPFFGCLAQYDESPY